MIGLLALLGIAIGVGCGEDGGAGPDAAVDAATDRMDGGADPDAGATDAGVDADRGPESCAATWIEEIRGSIVDEAGAPVEGARPQACLRVSPSDALVCLAPPIAAADGSYTIDVRGDERCVIRLALRVLLPSSSLAPTYCHLDASASVDGTLALAEPSVLYDTLAPAELPPLADETAERTVRFDDGLELDVVPARIGFGAEYATLRGRRVPLRPGVRVPCFADEVPGITGVYAFRDEGPIEGGTFAVRIPNPTGLAPGSRVELLVLGGLETRLADGTAVEEADFAPFGTATVSADGSTIASDPGMGLPHFSWLAYRPAP